jgi:hypothetical protein
VPDLIRTRVSRDVVTDHVSRMRRSPSRHPGTEKSEAAPLEELPACPLRHVRLLRRRLHVQTLV